ncbi:hypothetical protein AGMMS49992_14340 [Clostridia bacterium]|nr:hypothetical protein AGMMS49992_14340 [Clostridia bacterium]
MEEDAKVRRLPKVKPAADPGEKRRRRIAIIGLAAILLLLAVGAVAIGAPLIRWVTDPAQFRAWAQGHGAAAKWAMLGIAAVQVVLAFIPGEPIQIAAGMAFGTWWGVMLVMAGIGLGQAVVFALVKRYGMRFVELFFDKESIYNLPLFQNHKRLDSLIFLLFFIPGMPKDLFTYAAALTPIGIWQFLGLSMLARSPAMFASAWGGSAISGSRWKTAGIVLGVTALIGLGGIIYYRRIQQRRESKANPSSKELQNSTDTHENHRNT